jgi:hypothetical protein
VAADHEVAVASEHQCHWQHRGNREPATIAVCIVVEGADKLELRLFLNLFLFVCTRLKYNIYIYTGFPRSPDATATG